MHKFRFLFVTFCLSAGALCGQFKVSMPTAAAVLAASVFFAAPAAAQAPSEMPSLVQRAKCGAFYDKWDVPGAPAALAMFGMLHETLAARDCVEQKNTAQACDHYRKVLAGFEKLDPTVVAEHTPTIKARMAEIDCR
jgi:hypothetical protein